MQLSRRALLKGVLGTAGLLAVPPLLSPPAEVTPVPLPPPVPAPRPLPFTPFEALGGQLQSFANVSAFITPRQAAALRIENLDQTLTSVLVHRDDYTPFQWIERTDGVTGTFTLTANGRTTLPIPINARAGAVPVAPLIGRSVGGTRYRRIGRSDDAVRVALPTGAQLIVGLFPVSRGTATDWRPTAAWAEQYHAHPSVLGCGYYRYYRSGAPGEAPWVACRESLRQLTLRELERAPTELAW